MITWSNLAEQLREYQLQSKSDWASVSIFSSPSSSSSSSSYGFGSSRVDVVIFVIWELVILAFLVLSVVAFLVLLAVSLYFRHMWIAFILICITILLLLCMRVTMHIRLARKKKRRMLLPLST